MTNSTNTMKTLRIIAYIMSALIVGFALMMFIGEGMQSDKRGTGEPMTLYVLTQLVLGGLVLLGLVLAWKWKMAGGIISLLAIIALFIVNPEAMVWPMFIFPAIAILFIVVAYRSKEPKEKE